MYFDKRIDVSTVSDDLLCSFLVDECNNLLCSSISIPVAVLCDLRVLVYFLLFLA